jgi:hypothetical protein
LFLDQAWIFFLKTIRNNAAASEWFLKNQWLSCQQIFSCAPPDRGGRTGLDGRLPAPEPGAITAASDQQQDLR